MDDKKKKIILAVVVILLVISVIYRLKNPFVQQRVERLTWSNADKGMVSKSIKPLETGGGKKKTGPLLAGYLKKNQAKGDVYANLFYEPEKKAFKPVKKPKSPPRKIETEKKEPRQADLKLGQIMDIETHLASYKIQGTYTGEDGRAVFLAKGKQVLVAREGDKIEGKYRIESIRNETIRIKALEINETIHLDLREFNHE